MLAFFFIFRLHKWDCSVGPSPSPSLSSHVTQTISVLDGKPSRLYIKLELEIFLFFTKISALYIRLYLQGMQCSQCSQLTEHESLVPPLQQERDLLWQIWAKWEIFTVFTWERWERGKLCDAEMVLISPVSSYNLPLTCCCRPHPSPPLYSRTLYRSQHHSSLSDGGILTRNNSYRASLPSSHTPSPGLTLYLSSRAVSSSLLA